MPLGKYFSCHSLDICFLIYFKWLKGSLQSYIIERLSFKIILVKCLPWSSAEKQYQPVFYNFCLDHQYPGFCRRLGFMSISLRGRCMIRLFSSTVKFILLA